MELALAESEQSENYINLNKMPLRTASYHKKYVGTSEENYRSQDIIWNKKNYYPLRWELLQINIFL